jgi:hypothetical protein
MVRGQLNLHGFTPEEADDFAASFDDKLSELAGERERLDLALLEYRTEAVDAVRVKATAAADAGSALDAAVRRARGLNATWQQIADAAGMTRQSAWKRWSSPTDHAHELDAAGRCSFCGATS